MLKDESKEESNDAEEEGNDGDAPEWTCQGCGFNNDIDPNAPNARICILCGKSSDEATTEIQNPEKLVAKKEPMEPLPLAKSSVDFQGNEKEKLQKNTSDLPTRSLTSSSRDELRNKLLEEMRQEDNAVKAKNRTAQVEVLKAEDQSAHDGNLSDEEEDESDFAYGSDDSDFAF